MSKVQSQAGNSLADIYDVEGSIAGIEILETRELGVIHEVGATVFSERFATSFRRLVSGDVLQSTTIDVLATTLPTTVARLLAVQVFSDNAARLERVTVSVRTLRPSEQEIPVWNWTVGASEPARFFDAAAIPAALDLLTPTPGNLFVPSFIAGSGQRNPDMVSAFAMRGVTTAFGAGTVFVRAVIYFAFPSVVGTRSRGLPIPSW